MVPPWVGVRPDPFGPASTPQATAARPIFHIPAWALEQIESDSVRK